MNVCSILLLNFLFLVVIYSHFVLHLYLLMYHCIIWGFVMQYMHHQDVNHDVLNFCLEGMEDETIDCISTTFDKGP